MHCATADLFWEIEKQHNLTFPYLRIDGKSLLILFLVKNVEEKEVEFFNPISTRKVVYAPHITVAPRIFRPYVGSELS